MIKVQILYFQRCPTYMVVEQTVREALAEEGIEAEVELAR